MHKNNLLKLASFLRKLPKEKFDLDYFVKGKHKSKHKLDCNSTACAIGWTPVVFPDVAKYYCHPHSKETCVRSIHNPLLGAFGTATLLFDLSIEQENYLFLPDYYRKDRRGPISVANRIERLVKFGKMDHQKGKYKGF